MLSSSWADLHVRGMLWFMFFYRNRSSFFPLFYSVLVSVSAFMALSTVFYSINSLDNSLLSHSVLISAFFAFLTIYVFMKVSLSPAIILCGGLGLNNAPAN